MHYMRSWDGHGREYAKIHMPIRQDPEEMIGTLWDWGERMQDTEFLRRAKKRMGLGDAYLARAASIPPPPSTRKGATDSGIVRCLPN